MKKTALLGVCIGALLLLFGIANPALGESYRPLGVSSSCSPKSITAPGEVTVTIIVTNQADGELTVPVTLLDPAGNQVSFSGGITSLAAQQKATYTGKWSVSAAELADGKLKYKLSSSELAENGSLIPYSTVASVAIKKEAASTSSASVLTGSYSVSPSTASKGQTVTLTYTLSNTSGTDIIDVTITNTSLTKEKIFISRLPAGDKVTKTFQYTMGSKSIKAKPKITYKMEGSTGGSKDVKTVNLGSKTIELEKGGVLVNLKAKGSTEVEPGSKVELTLTVTNGSNVTYKNIKISDTHLGEIATIPELKAKTGKHTETKTITVDVTADYTFSVKGTSDDGKELDLISNTMHLVAIDMSKRMQLEIGAVAQTTEASDYPAEIVFEVNVKNTGTSTGKDMVLKHGKTTIATIGTMAPGEEQTFVKRILVSMAGKFMFSVTGNNEQGASQTVDGNTVDVVYIEPTPEPPPPTIQPTAPPIQNALTATDAPADDAKKSGTAGGMQFLWIIAGALALALVAVLTVVIMGRRRQAAEAERGKNSIDSMQVSTRRNYAAAPRQQQNSRPARRPEKDEDAYEREYEQMADDADYGDAPEAYTGESMHELAERYGRPGAEEQGRPRKQGRGQSGDRGEAYLARMREAEADDMADEYQDASGDGRRRRRARSADA